MPVATIAADVTAAVAAHVAASNPHSQYFLASGVSAYGATLIDDADAATARTTLGLGTAAGLNVGTSAGNVVQLDGSARLPAVDGSQLTGITASASPAGSDTQLQYNNAGVLAGASGITRTASGELTLSTRLVAPVIRPASDSTTAFRVQDAAGTSDVVTVDTTNKVTMIRSDSVSTSAPGTKILELANSTSTFSFHRVHNPGISLDRWTMRFLPNPTYSTTPMDIAVDWNNGNSAINLTNLGINFINTSSAFLQQGTQLSLNITANRVFQLWHGAGTGLGMQYRPDSYWKIVNAFGAYNIIYASATGYVAMGHGTPTCVLDIAASTTSRASLRLRSGTAPTIPNDGDVWYDGTNFKCRIGGVTRTFTVT